MTKLIPATLAAAAIMMAASTATAQESPTPSRSIESYQAWTVECTNIALPKKDADNAEEEQKFRKVCEVIQTYTNQKTGNEVARLAFAYEGEDKKKLIAGLRTLVDTSFEKGPSIMVGEEALFEGKFTRCARIHCFARFDLDPKKLDSLTGADKAAVQYPVSNGRTIRINVSSNGLSDALAALKAKD